MKENHCQCPQSVQLAGGRPPRGRAKDDLYLSRTANNVTRARNALPVAASDEPFTVTFRPSADGVTHKPFVVIAPCTAA